MYVILFLGQKGDCGAETAARKKTRRMALDNGGIFAWSACPGGVIIISNNQKSPQKMNTKYNFLKKNVVLLVSNKISVNF